MTCIFCLSVAVSFARAELSWKQFTTPMLQTNSDILVTEVDCLRIKMMEFNQNAFSP